MIINANALHIPLKDATVQCCVTSPPYYGLRDYGISDQIGLEPTPDEYVAKLVSVFREVKRVLKDDGVLWLNLGDSYGGNREHATESATATCGNTILDVCAKFNKVGNGVKPKDLIGIPWMVAFALRADGWYLRSDIIWSKPNPMPESVKDRPTKAHEYLFLLAKSQKYYYDAEAIFEPASAVSVNRIKYGWDCDRVNIGPGGNGSVHTDRMGDRWVSKTRGFKTKDQLSDNQHHGKDIESYGLNGAGFKGHSGNYDADGNLLTHDIDGVPARNKRTVWTITTQPFRGAHFAVMPEKLVEPCILAGSRPGDVILDPFSGSGTVGVVAQKLGRGFVGIELNPEYVKLAETRMMDTPVSLFNQSILEEL